MRRIYPEDGGVKLLLAAIIRRAAFDIALYSNDRRLANRKIAVGAYNWMFSDTDPEHQEDRFTSFLNICEVLDIDPGWIRDRTMKLKRVDVKKFNLVGPA